MSASSDFKYLVKEELRDPLFEQIEDHTPVKKEPVDTLDSIKNEHKKIVQFENNEDAKVEICGDIKQDYDLQDCIKEEKSFQCYTSRLEETKHEFLDLYNIKTENIKIEDSHIVEDVKEELITDIQEEYKYEDIKYSIDIEEHKVEYSGDCDLTVTSCNEDNISRTRNNKLKISSKDEGVQKQDTLEAFNCDNCCKTFHEIPKLKRHIEVVHTRAKYKKNKCTEIISSIHHLTMHIDSVQGATKNCECKLCGKMFSQHGYLNTHIDTVHKGIKKYECNLCGKMFSQCGNLNKHTDSVHRQIKKYNCKLCGKMFSQSGHLSTHIDSVHREIRYDCKLCGKMFSSPQNLITHTDSVHKGIKKYKCKLCGKMFSQRNRLNTHIDTVHRGIKKYKCKLCDKMFSKCESLNTHIDTVHRGIKKYECKHCGKMFSRSQTLNRHTENVHRRIDMYECNDCNKKFLQKSQIKFHIGRVHI